MTTAHVQKLQSGLRFTADAARRPSPLTWTGRERTNARDFNCSGIPQTSRQAWVDDEVHHCDIHTSHKMASQLMPLELIDRCIGSRMRVIMKGDKGEPSPARIGSTSQLTTWQSSVAPCSDLMTSSVCDISHLQCAIIELTIPRHGS